MAKSAKICVICCSIPSLTNGDGSEENISNDDSFKSFCGHLEKVKLAGLGDGGDGRKEEDEEEEEDFVAKSLLALLSSSKGSEKLTICESCKILIKKVLQAKEVMIKVEERVYSLQMQLLNELKVLRGRTEGFSREMGKIGELVGSEKKGDELKDFILKEGGSSKSWMRRDTTLFRSRIIEVCSGLSSFHCKLTNRLQPVNVNRSQSVFKKPYQLKDPLEANSDPEEEEEKKEEDPPIKMEDEDPEFTEELGESLMDFCDEDVITEELEDNANFDCLPQPPLEFIVSSRNIKYLVLNNHLYRHHKDTQTATKFECVFRQYPGCPCKISILGYQWSTDFYSSYSIKNSHSHAPCPGKIKKVKEIKPRPPPNPKTLKYNTGGRHTTTKRTLINSEAPLEFIRTRKGRHCLVINGHTYYLAQGKGKVGYFECTNVSKAKGRCRATVKLPNYVSAEDKEYHSYLEGFEHNHPPSDPQKIFHQKVITRMTEILKGSPVGISSAKIIQQIVEEFGVEILEDTSPSFKRVEQPPGTLILRRRHLIGFISRKKQTLESGKVICDECGLEFYSDLGLQGHQNEGHPVEALPEGENDGDSIDIGEEEMKTTKKIERTLKTCEEPLEFIGTSRNKRALLLDGHSYFHRIGKKSGYFICVSNKNPEYRCKVCIFIPNYEGYGDKEYYSYSVREGVEHNHPPDLQKLFYKKVHNRLKEIVKGSPVGTSSAKIVEQIKREFEAEAKILKFGQSVSPGELPPGMQILRRPNLIRYLKKLKEDMGNRKVICDECGLEFYSEMGLQRHQDEDHQGTDV